MATATTTSTTTAAAGSTTTTTGHRKIRTQPIRQKQRRYRETTISASATGNNATTTTTTATAYATTNTAANTDFFSHNTTNRKLETPTIVSPDNSWCSTASKLILCPPPPQQRQVHSSIKEHDPTFIPDSPSTFRIRFSPGSLSPVMDCTHNGTPPPTGDSSESAFPSSFSKFNSVLTAGLLNPMSPPPDKIRSSPTLFEMMASEPDIQPKTQIPNANNIPLLSSQKVTQHHHQQSFDTQQLKMQRISDLLLNRSPGNQFNESTSSDIKLTLSSKDGMSVSLNVHRQILVAHSRFFAVQMSDRLTKQQHTTTLPYIVEIADCDDVEVYIETLRLMYCKDLKKKLMKEDVSKVLGILKVSAAIGFDAGVLSCLEYLEAAPWAEDEEEKVASLLSELQLEGVGAGEVLKRVSVEVTNGTEEGSDNEGVILKLLHVVLEGKDEKARREMKGLVSKMLRENSSQNDLRKESLYSACNGCLQLLHNHFLQASSGDLRDVGQIARQADNLHWILDILIDRQIAEDFLKVWASQYEISEVHSKVPAVHRYEVSRITARLFVGIGKGQLLASKDVRCLLLQTWLKPFYDDFGWMRRASNGLDRHLIEDGLSNTILTLPLAWQQEILLAWFNRFLNSGEDCPNIKRGFEVWWRRAFWRRNSEQERPQQFRITTATIENS